MECCQIIATKAFRSALIPPPLGRAGSGHFFSGPGLVWAGIFWPGLGSGWRFLATGQFGPSILAYFGPFLPIFDQFFG